MAKEQCFNMFGSASLWWVNQYRSKMSHSLPVFIKKHESQVLSSFPFVLVFSKISHVPISIFGVTLNASLDTHQDNNKNWLFCQLFHEARRRDGIYWRCQGLLIIYNSNIWIVIWEQCGVFLQPLHTKKLLAILHFYLEWDKVSTLKSVLILVAWNSETEQYF